MAKLQKYLVKIRNEVLPKSPAAKAVRYELNQWDALSRQPRHRPSAGATGRFR
jgi:hypothetical protein